jgi:hypothetical protein
VYGNRKKIDLRVGDFLLAIPTNLVLPEEDLRAALALEEYHHSLENLIARYDICLKVFGNYVVKYKYLFPNITMLLFLFPSVDQN